MVTDQLAFGFRPRICSDGASKRERSHEVHRSHSDLDLDVSDKVR